jgi:hypothetical protein
MIDDSTATQLRGGCEKSQRLEVVSAVTTQPQRFGTFLARRQRFGLPMAVVLVASGKALKERVSTPWISIEALRRMGSDARDMSSCERQTLLSVQAHTNPFCQIGDPSAAEPTVHFVPCK